MNSPTVQRFAAQRRTFQAAKFPPGSPGRVRLNESGVTSEYMTTHRYVVVDQEHPAVTAWSFRTKREAEDFIASQTRESR